MLPLLRSSSGESGVMRRSLPLSATLPCIVKPSIFCKGSCSLKPTPAWPVPVVRASAWPSRPLTGEACTKPSTSLAGPSALADTASTGLCIRSGTDTSPSLRRTRGCPSTPPLRPVRRSEALSITSCPSSPLSAGQAGSPADCR